MHRLAILFVAALVATLTAGTVVADTYTYNDRFDEEWQEQEMALSRGGFAVLVMKVIETDPEYWYNIDPVRATDQEKLQALTEAKRLELVPQVWTIDEMLLSGDLYEFMILLGVSFVADREDDNEVSRSYAEAVLQRVASRLKDYTAKRTGHGWSSAHEWLDEGVDRAVSPIYIGRWE